MLRVDVAREARADLEDMLATSFERWGEAGRARHQALLEAAVDEIVADPEHVMSRIDVTSRPGFAAFTCDPWVGTAA